MIITNEYLHPQLVDVYDGVANKENLFEYVAERLSEKDYIEPTFLKAISDREKEFPTGLETPSYGVAIPHTDPQHIIKPFIYIVKLNEPISFGQMGTTDVYVNAEYAFFLGFNKGEDQLKLLQTLMAMFMDEEAMKTLNDLTEKKAIFSVVTNYFS